MSNALPLRRVAPALMGALVLGACSAKGAAPSGSASRSSSGQGTPPPAVRVQLVVQVQPYHLPVAVEREVAAYWAGQIYLAGGLDTTDTATSGVFARDARSGSVT
ncbi:MAG TPA: hypothetical protein DIT48_05470 [Actinobacteria bacterium]|nr:hypothetical protein [Actinomycetota bacterium]